MGLCGWRLSFPDYPWDPKWSFPQINSVKLWEHVLQRHLLKYPQQIASHSVDPLQKAGTLRARTDTEQTATQKAGPSDLTVQGAVMDKLAEEDTTFQRLRTAKIKIFGAARRELTKDLAVFFVLGDSAASEFCILTFQNHL
jgi:hypothetical protein